MHFIAAVVYLFMKPPQNYKALSENVECNRNVIQKIQHFWRIK